MMLMVKLMVTEVDDGSGNGDCNNDGALMIGTVMKMV